MTTPARGPATGPEPPTAADRTLPALLLALTAVSGVVDAVSFLALDHVFVAAQTGNLIFLGFAVIGAPGFVLVAVVATIAGFIAGAFTAGQAILRHAPRRTRLLRSFSLVQLIALLIAVAVVAAAAWAGGAAPPVPLLLALIAFAMGIQAAGAARMKVPGLERTTVLTTTLTNVAIDTFGTPAERRVALRGLASIVVLIVGAAIGGLLLLHVGLLAPLALATALVAAVVVVAVRLDARAHSANGLGPISTPPDI